MRILHSMKTICIETQPSSAIGWWVRLSSDEIIYTSYQWDFYDPIRTHNCKRFSKEIKKICKSSLYNILNENNNIQIVHNNWDSWIAGLYTSPESHSILSKTWLVKIFLNDEKMKKYIPKSIIIPASEVSIEKIIDVIEEGFVSGSKFVLKHSMIDGNWNGVGISEYDWVYSNLKCSIQNICAKFANYLKEWETNLFNSEYLIQEFIWNQSREGSITFSIQNNRIENRWLVNNVTENWEYFWSTNFFSYINNDEKYKIEKSIEFDFNDLLINLQSQWIRGNVSFDLLFTYDNWSWFTYVLECNGIHRTTGSSMPNSFCFNTKNDVFLWVPLSKKRLSEKHKDLTPNKMLDLAIFLQWFWIEQKTPQIMNIKTEWFERWYPVAWIAVAGATINELVDLFNSASLTNNAWKNYVNKIFDKMKGI